MRGKQKVTMRPYYKELARQKKAEEYEKFRIAIQRAHCRKYGIAFADSVLYKNPVLMDVQPTYREEIIIFSSFKKRPVGKFFWNMN